jgi:hypothetical protein
MVLDLYDFTRLVGGECGDLAGRLPTRVGRETLRPTEAEDMT